MIDGPVFIALRSVESNENLAVLSEIRREKQCLLVPNQDCANLSLHCQVMRVVRMSLSKLY